MLYLLYIPLGLIPSLIWLSYYLRKDKHPESNTMVLKIFIWGILMAPLAIILELALIWLINPTSNLVSVLSHMPGNSLFKIILASTLIPALVEEYLKYSVVKYKVLNNSEFDEPVDAMLYCIIAGLGFAAIENLLILFKSPLMPLGQALGTIGLRFLGATFLHALASGITGYWLARGILFTQQRKKFVLIGLTIAIFFHACYNYLVILVPGQTSYNRQFLIIAGLIILLTTMALLVGLFLKKLKRERGLCKI